MILLRGFFFHLIYAKYEEIIFFFNFLARTRNYY